MNKKKVAIVGATAVVLGLVATGVVLRNKYDLKLSKGEYVYELGDEVSTNPLSYLKKDSEKDIKKNVKNESKLLKSKDIVYDSKKQTIISKDSKYLNVGKYEMTFKYRGQSKTAKIIVKDTKAPEIKDIKNIEVTEGVKKVDYSKYFKVSDLSKVNVKVDDSKVKLNKAGKYTAKITAEDEYKNKSSKELKVTVKKKPVKKVEKSSSNSGGSNNSQGSSGSYKPSKSNGHVSQSNNVGYPKSYSNGSVSVTVSREWYGSAYVYAAHVRLSDYSKFRGEYLGGQYLSSAASRNNAILAINGDWASPNGYTEIRGGQVICQTNMPEGAYSASNGLLWYGQNGYGGATETFCFGPAFLLNGGITGPSGGGRAQRTFIGTNGNPGDLWLCVSDGRYNDGASAGLTPYECAAFLQSKGCTFGVPLDGGGSSEIIFQGQILNGASAGERALNDALYVLH